MPYDPENPPEKVKKLSPKKQKQWCEVWNETYQRTKDESQAFSTAWGVARKSSTDELVNVAESEGSLADATRNSDILVTEDTLNHTLKAVDDSFVAKDMVRIAKELEALDA